ncbi:hypothetical protein [Brevundimonas sp. SL161]|uniref:hypothetical protein n=1 Tax=Brevundimonas sp. SL161 TaxID=2804613 RepID=UPI003CEE80D4
MDLQDCEAAFLEVEEHAHQALGCLGLLLTVHPDDLETLDSRRRLEEVSDAIAALEKLERYRTPRFRAWVKSLETTQAQPTRFSGNHRVNDASSG